MVQVYVRLIKGGLRTLEQVPEIWRADVQEILDQDSH